MMDYIQRLFERHGLNTCVSTCFCFSKLPIEKLLFQARWNLRPWSDLELLLENLPPRMEKNALMRGEDRYMRTPLHDVAWKAPRSIIKLILALAPDATRIKDKDGELPVSLSLLFLGGVKRCIGRKIERGRIFDGFRWLEIFLNAYFSIFFTMLSSALFFLL